MNKRGQNYMYGTAARKLKPEVQKRRKVSKRKLEKVSSKNKIKMLFHVVFSCMLALVMMYRYCLLTEMNYAIDKKYSEYEKLRNRNIALKVDIDREQNLLKIKEVAYDRLDMRSAQKDQIVYVKVPANDFVRYANDGGKSGIFNIILRKLKEFKNYF